MKIKGRVSIFVSLIVFAGMLMIIFLSYFNYSSIINDDILNISKLTSTSIFSKINNELTKPVFVSLTMANDSFLENWLIDEDNRSEEEIIEFLNGIRKKYNYSSVFLVSGETGRYFHYNGLHKIISENDDHDVWYYKFRDSQKTFELDIDQDEADNNVLTIFVNCKIFDDDNNFIGVTGVGIKMDYAQQILNEFEKDYNLEAFLVDSTGNVQVHTNKSFIETRNISNEKIYDLIGEEIYDKNNEINVFRTNLEGSNKYVISHYIEEMGWFLIVKKDTSILEKTLSRQMIYSLGISAVMVILILIFVYRLINSYENRLDKLSKTDYLTGLINRKGFDEILKEKIERNEGNWTLIIFDIDDFKKINDKFGHLHGDKIIIRIAKLAEEFFGNGLARWGGDEFAVILDMSLTESEKTISEFIEKVEKDVQLKEFGTKISLGAVENMPIETEDSIVKKADQAMYLAKNSGSPKYYFWK